MSTTDSITIVVPNPIAWLKRNTWVFIFAVGFGAGAIVGPPDVLREVVDVVIARLFKPRPAPPVDPSRPDPSPVDPKSPVEALGAQAAVKYRQALLGPIAQTLLGASSKLDAPGATTAGFAATVKAGLATTMNEAVRDASKTYGAALQAQFGPPTETPMDDATKAKLKAFTAGAASEFGR